MTPGRDSFLVRCYWLSRKCFERLIGLLAALFNGFWLGVLSRSALQAVDRAYYDREPVYQEEDYNCRGLFEWERAAIRQFFPDCKRILLVGAGGGREVLALARMGYQIDGFECHPALVQAGNQLLESQGLPARLQLIERDQSPDGPRMYDGAILGWGAYMLVQGKERRVRLLRQLGARVCEGAPLLVSFFEREGAPWRMKLTAVFGNVIRGLLGRERLDPGDDLAPNYAHYFTREQLAGELRSGGFELAFYSTRSYGHAVGIAKQVSMRQVMGESQDMETNNE